MVSGQAAQTTKAALGIVRRRLPQPLRCRLAWAKAHGRPSYMWMPFDDVVAEVLQRVFSTRLGYPLNLDAPRTFNEKIQWRKAYDRREVLPLLVDKYRVREYVRERVGEEYLIPLLHVTTDPRSIPIDDLDVPYIVKPNNGSGFRIIVTEESRPDWAVELEALENHMRELYGLADVEWAYWDAPPCVVVERLLQDEEGRLPRDYKFHVFDGRVAYIQVLQDRESGLRSVAYDRGWGEVDLRRPSIPVAAASSPPPNAELMITLAERLAGDLDYARVDLYNLDGRVYFGEVTIYPASGLRPFEPADWDRRWGELWTLPPRSHVAASP